MIVAQRLRKGSAGSPRGAKRLVGDAVRTTRRLLGKTQLILVRMDSAFYGRGPVHAALAGGAAVSVTVRMDRAVRRAIATIDEDAWTTIEYTDAVFDETTGRWISRAEVAELSFTAFSAQKKTEQVPGRLVVRRIPDFNAEAHKAAGQDSLFDVWRFHAFFTTAEPKILDTVAADKTHRHHAVIEQVHSDLKNSALAHLPSGVFTANAAWLVLAVIAFNLTRAAGTVAAQTWHGQPPQRSAASWSPCPHEWRPQPDASPCTCPKPGPGRSPGPLCSTGSATPRPSSRPDHPAAPAARPEQHREHPDSEVREPSTPSTAHPSASQITRSPPCPSVDRGLDTMLRSQVLRDLSHRGIRVPVDPDHVLAELHGKRLRHGRRSLPAPTHVERRFQMSTYPCAADPAVGAEVVGIACVALMAFSLVLRN